MAPVTFILASSLEYKRFAILKKTKKNREMSASLGRR